MKRPNIVFIVTDQQRYDSLGCTGNPHAVTPHLDALAAENTVCDRFITNSAICSPSRASIFTGLQASTHGLWTNGVALPSSVPYDDCGDKPEAFQHLMRKRDAHLKRPEWNRRIRQYTDALNHLIDRSVGRIVDTLKEIGAWENTMLVFTSDHADDPHELTNLASHVNYADEVERLHRDVLDELARTTLPRSGRISVW